ncbi:hypothetical protein Mal4_38420 [Maioricimonas rarisocia]|uniref:Uncharacterized protein n=1 Tax=Maioricimonas rarisocia TaxID=2528026 RepID=A0A517ZAL7_9PLAN|nr:hypothetical protein [Maioricimonas rarisocia]QDU39497.1 hypothetical protein Mal4_38420 [Maioricimonas rarisocia]
MSDTRLRIYLNDHLGLVTGEAELARRCRDSNKGTSLALFLDRLQSELETQRAAISDVIRLIGGRESRIKQGAGWLAEKLGRFKMNDSLLSYSDLSRLLELEALSAAAHERVALWDTLCEVLGGDDRFGGISFPWYRDQSLGHFNELNSERRKAVPSAFPRPVKVEVRVQPD